MKLPQAGEDLSTFPKVIKEGSPLDTGHHLIRLHYDSGAVMLDKFVLTMMKPHKASPDLVQASTTGKQWVLKWSDEFNGTGLPDSTKWVYDFGDWGWGNNELQYYTAERVENARQEDGNLIIEAKKDDMGHPWTSARLTTRGKQSFLYGKIEFRAKVPVGRGTWSAGWLLGNAYVDEKSWPNCGEVDVLEMVGYQTDSVTKVAKAHASIHCGAYYFKLKNQPTKIRDIKNVDGEFHSYTMEWMPDKIVISVDGVRYFKYNDTRTALSWPYDKPQNLILNLAMGGGMGGVKGVDSTMTSQKLIFDYIRVYELK
jgi:beta-glucanase (GH16 family)